MKHALKAAAAAVLVAGPALAACAAGDIGADGRDGDDDRVRVAMLQPPRSGLSPYSDDAFKLTRWGVVETLVTLDADGVPQRALATAWEQTTPHTWTFTLREGVRFHDGTPLTADRVVESLQRAADAAPPPRILDGVELTVRREGDKVTVTTAQPDPLLPNRLSSPQLPVLAERAYAGQAVDVRRAGTGPFVLTETRGVSGATLERNDDYWGERAQVAGIDVSYVPDGAARAAALRTGEADIVEAVPVAQASLLDPDLIEEVPMPRTSTLYLKTRSGPFADAGERARARDAIDTAVLVEGVHEGHADRAEGLLGPALPWTARRETRTPATAPAGRATSRITIATYSDRPELPEMLTVLQQQLEAAGYRVQQEVREYAQIEADMLAGEFDAFLLSRATVLDSGDPVAYLASDFTCDGSFNISGLCDPTVDRAVKAAAALPAGTERQDAILRAEAAVLRTDAAVPLLHDRVVQGAARGLAGVAYDPRERLLVVPGTHWAGGERGER